MEILIGWFVFSTIVGIVAASRGRSGVGWFLLAALVSPLVAVIFCLILRDLSVATQAQPTPLTHVKCPDCRELVLKDARKCKHCGIAIIPQD